MIGLLSKLEKLSIRCFGYYDFSKEGGARGRFMGRNHDKTVEGSFY